ncbi:hypothetical protein BGZ92_007305 [Podila epicladia]|nr:hypothetical protein BGZ92_007305 [Podila epicladia]
MMLMESQENEPVNNVGNSPEQHHAMTLDNNPKAGEGTDQESASIPTSPPSQPKAFLERNLPGTKDEKLYQWPPRPLDSIESPFALREYLQALIRQDPHNVDQLVAVPKDQNENPWTYEHLCQVCLELNYLIVQVEPECTPESCPEMRAEEWIYYCATHPAPRECCAIDYLTHTLDGASALLNNVKFFPSRIAIASSASKNFTSIARRLYRIFAHTYFHHRDIFDAFEAETSLYERFLKMCKARGLITDKLIIIPEQSQEDEPPTLSTRQIMTRTNEE